MKTYKLGKTVRLMTDIKGVVPAILYLRIPVGKSKVYPIVFSLGIKYGQYRASVVFGDRPIHTVKIPFARRGLFSDVRESLSRTSLRLNPFKQYVYFWSRDCDQFESQYVRKYKNGREALKQIEGHYDSAEGPCSARLVGKSEYLAYQADCAEERRTGRRINTRDHRAEQYNY